VIDFHFMAEEGWIDAHAHVWSDDTARYPLGEGYRKEQMRPARFEPEELLAHARPCGVSRIVLIQMSYYRFDNGYMLDAMARYPGTFGGVAVVDSRRPDAPERMRELKEREVRGFRILAPELSAPAMEAMWECAAREELAICPLINPPELAALEWMCAKHPRTPVVIDHFARIGIDGEIRQADLERLCGLARFPRVHVKVSAFYALGRKRYPYTDLLPMIERLVRAYGAERLMWGTDCPYQVMDGHGYEGSLELVRDRLRVKEAEREWLLKGTAERVFFS